MTDISGFKETGRERGRPRMKHRLEVQVVKRTLGACCLYIEREKKTERSIERWKEKRVKERPKYIQEKERESRFKDTD